jgi:hypothetical protein
MSTVPWRNRHKRFKWTAAADVELLRLKSDPTNTLSMIGLVFGVSKQTVYTRLKWHSAQDTNPIKAPPKEVLPPAVIPMRYRGIQSCLPIIESIISEPIPKSFDSSPSKICQWIIRESHYCSEPSVAGYSYCEEHGKLAFVNFKPKTKQPVLEESLSEN